MEQQQCTVGVDLGGTKIGIGVVSSEGIVLEEQRLPTQGAGAEAVIVDLVAAIKPLLQRPEYYIRAVGVGIAGQIAADDGRVLFAPNLKWKDIPLQAMLEQQLGIPVTVLNDVRAATWGEWQHGAGRGCDDFLCLFVGTGLGGGIVADGRLLTGSSNSAGEIGHTTLVWKGRLCSCGHQGCLEAYVSGWGIAQTLREAAAADPQLATVLLALAGGQPDQLKGEHLATALAKGDHLAAEIFQQLAEALTAGCISFVNTLNPKRLLLGGGVIQGLPNLIEYVSEGIKKGALTAATAHLEVMACALESDAPLIGAAAAALQKVKKL